MTRTTRLAGIAVAGALALAACASEPPKTPATTTAVVPPTSATTTTSAPSTSTTPAENPGVALVKNYIGALNTAIGSGDTSTFRTFFTTDCTACLQGATAIESATRDGQVVKGGRYKLSNVSEVSAKPLLVQARLEHDAIVINDANGKVVRQMPASTASVSIFRIEMVGGQLKIVEIDR